MFRQLNVHNFKSLVHFTVDFSEMTVIVGNNASGKSSILQALDFLCASIREDFSIILERRGWKVENIKSKLIQSDRIHFEAIIDLTGVLYTWEMVLAANKKKNELLLFEESVYVNGNLVLKYKHNAGMYYKNGKTSGGNTDAVSIMAGNHSSVLKLLAESKNTTEELSTLLGFLKRSESFELLSPAEMRLSTRKDVSSIGNSGRELPSFLKRMNADQKKSYMSKLQSLLRGQITSVDTRTKRLGWTQIVVSEHFKDADIEINSLEMSDGMLRLLAFLAISEINEKGAVFLLDEIENGINTNYAEKMMTILGGQYKKKNHQLVLTTHSTVFIDYVNADSIVFLYRERDGRTSAKKMFQSVAMRDALEYMWPGEMLLNYSQSELVERILK